MELVESLPEIFDRGLLRRRRDRYAATLDRADFLFREVTDRLLDRLGDVARHFPLALDLGCHTGQIAKKLSMLKISSIDKSTDTPIDRMIQCDLSSEMAVKAGQYSPALTADEEALPFAPHSIDLILSCLSLHWVNDLPGTLIQIQRTLKPDGFFLGAMLGGETLSTLRTCLIEAEMTLYGGVSPRFSPTVDLREMAALMQRSGFALPVVDRESIIVTYENAFALMKDIRQMGEANIVHERHRGFSSRTLFMRAAELYQERYQLTDGRIEAVFDIFFLHGWAPHPSQAKPLQPGTASKSLVEVFQKEQNIK